MFKILPQSFALIKTAALAQSSFTLTQVSINSFFSVSTKSSCWSENTLVCIQFLIVAFEARVVKVVNSKCTFFRARTYSVLLLICKCEYLCYFQKIFKKIFPESTSRNHLLIGDIYSVILNQKTTTHFSFRSLPSP